MKDYLAHKLEPHTGTLVGLAIIVAVDGNAKQVLQIPTKEIPLIQASEVELSIVPIVQNPPQLPRTVETGTIRERLERG